MSMAASLFIHLSGGRSAAGAISFSGGGALNGAPGSNITDATVQVQYDRGWLTFDGQIVIRGLERRKFSDSGDSGSLIVEKTSRKAVGLLFAGGTGYTLANPIQAVLKALKVSLVTKA